jgi:hypothetical protein
MSIPEIIFWCKVFSITLVFTLLSILIGNVLIAVVHKISGKRRRWNWFLPNWD